MSHHRLQDIRKLRGRIKVRTAKPRPVFIPHDLPKPHGADHAADIGEPHTGQQLEDWFNTYHKCNNCHKVIRTYEQLHASCKGGSIK